MTSFGDFGNAWAERQHVATEPGQPGLYLALAPMDGVTDFVYREVLTDLFGGRSGISACTCEFVRVTRQLVPERVFLRHCPELRDGGRTPSGVPVFVQLLGGDPECMADNAVRAVEFGAIGIDLNFGCPAKTVNNSDGGAALLRDPARVMAVTQAVRRAVPAAVPVSVKVRTGWDSAEHMVDIATAAEAGGGAWLTIHGRTRKQGYKPPVDWAAIGRARAAVSIPVVANGNVSDAESLRACGEQTGAHGFMIGRAAMGMPETFARIRGWHPAQFSRSELFALVRRYADRMIAGGTSERGALNRLKQWLRMGGAFRAELATQFEQTKRAQSLAEALERIEIARQADAA